MVMSRTVADSSVKVRALYREISRRVPLLVTRYNLSCPPSQLQKCIRARFDVNRNIANPQAVDLLVRKGHMDLIEAVSQFKTRTHVVEYTMMPKVKKDAAAQQNFLGDLFKDRLAARA